MTRPRKPWADRTTVQVALDPWVFFGLSNPGPAWGKPTERQAAMLRRHGVPQPESKRQASALIAAILDRAKAGLCTYRQACDLLAIGHPPRAYTRVEAKQLISAEFEWEGAGGPAEVWGEMDAMGYEGDY